jgi:hypothetical protein
MENKQQGAAEIRLTLENSTITAYHFDGTELFSKPAIKGDWERIWSAIHAVPAPVTPTELKAFLEQPGINLTGICKEAGITKQPLYRYLNAGRLPGAKMLEKLLPVLRKYGLRASGAVQS